jgi:fluoride exporter
MTWLLVALGGALGSLARHGVTVAAARWFPATFPYGTLVVNAIGCAIFGLLLGVGESRQLLTPAVRAFCLVGVLGGFTTFSSYSAESMALLRSGAWTLALINTVGQVVIGLAAVALGWWAGRALT